MIETTTKVNEDNSISLEIKLDTTQQYSRTGLEFVKSRILSELDFLLASHGVLVED